MLNPNIGMTQNIGGNANALAQPAIQANLGQQAALQALNLSKINSQQGFQDINNQIANQYGQMEQNGADPLNPGNLIGLLGTLGGGLLPTILGPAKPNTPGSLPPVNVNSLYLPPNPYGLPLEPINQNTQLPTY